ncbi:MAG TPA: rRNA maturation RNase YbeY, partial [Candidatus Eisenbacteria bacterium]
ASGLGRSRAGARAPVSGDIVVSLDRMAEQARRFRVGRGHELARLVIHGALHLAGLDHHRAAERRLMRRRESQVLKAGRRAIVELAGLDRRRRS